MRRMKSMQHFFKVVFVFVLQVAVMNVSRDESGIQCLYEYYNQLYFIEKKFFPKAGGMSVYFHW